MPILKKPTRNASAPILKKPVMKLSKNSASALKCPSMDLKVPFSLLPPSTLGKHFAIPSKGVPHLQLRAEWTPRNCAPRIPYSVSVLDKFPLNIPLRGRRVTRRRPRRRPAEQRGSPLAISALPTVRENWKYPSWTPRTKFGPSVASCAHGNSSWP